MSVFRKQVLRVGSYRSPDGQIVVTPDRLRHWEKSFQNVKQAGYNVPVHFNHAKPNELDKLCPIKTDSDSGAEDTVGHLEGFQVDPSGQSAVLTMSLKKPSAVESAASNVVYVSPVLWDEWTDGAAKTHRDIISSVDLVDYPVDYSQGPFEPVKMSAATRNKKSKKPKIVRFSLSAEEPMDEDKTPETPETPAEEQTVPETNSVLSSVLAGLASMKVVLPGDTDTSNFLERLNVALMTKAAQDESENPNEVQEPESPAEPVSPQIATMSARVKQLEDRIVTDERNAVKARLDEVLKSGRCTPAEHRVQSQAMSVQRMSLAKDGKVDSGEIGLWLQSREAIPEGSCWSKEEKIKRMSTETPSPKTEWDTKEKPDVEKQKKDVNTMLRR